MSNAPQPDLFSVLAAPAAAGIAMLPQPPRPPMAPLFPVPPSLEWEKILRASPHGDNVTIMALRDWPKNGAILEVLREGADGKRVISHEKKIWSMTPDRGAFGRLVYCGRETAFAWHMDRGLIPIPNAFGTHGAMFRFARDNETVPGSIYFPWEDA